MRWQAHPGTQPHGTAVGAVQSLNQFSKDSHLKDLAQVKPTMCNRSYLNAQAPKRSSERALSELHFMERTFAHKAGQARQAAIKHVITQMASGNECKQCIAMC